MNPASQAVFAACVSFGSDEVNTPSRSASLAMVVRFP